MRSVERSLYIINEHRNELCNAVIRRLVQNLRNTIIMLVLKIFALLIFTLSGQIMRLISFFSLQIMRFSSLDM